VTYPDPNTPAYPQAVYPQTLVVPTSGKATAALILGLAASRWRRSSSATGKPQEHQRSCTGVRRSEPASCRAAPGGRPTSLTSTA
jgi:hypothetical protein